MAKKTKTVECIAVNDQSGDGPYLWRLDKKGEGERFFKFIRDNYETCDPYQIISVMHLSITAWKKAEKRGKELS